ncbi:uncharacterized protein LOC107617078 [Arachis ipaensis]|nr:uncharacterized protein LOC107617078 [Arachis ipaensis]
MPPEPREESLEACELCCRRCSTAEVLPILGPLPAVHKTVEPPSTVRHPELSRPLPVPGKLESRDFYLITRSRWFAEKMIEASPFSSLDHATSFVRQLWFKESSIQSWLDAFSGQSHLYRAIGHAPASLMRELFQWDRKYRAKFGFDFITRLSRPKIQEASEEPGEVVPDSMDKEDVVSSDGSDEAVSAGQNGFMLSYDLNKTPEENEYPYSGMSPEKKNA